MNYFKNYIKKGSYVLVSNGNRYVRALGKVTGDYEYKEDAPFEFNHFRKVEWIFVDENIPVEEIYDRKFSQVTLYKIDQNGLNQNFFTNKGREESIREKEKKKYILIIDEINRGNVSSIFGELITLIEKNKRSGGNEELEVTLPYSKSGFKVPDNVYIIGTMNTADRSIEALDTALRRRFSFVHMEPKSAIIKDYGKSKGQIEDVDVCLLLDKINERIEKLIDKDHRIGHSYFMDAVSIDDLKLVFRDAILPLLQEYFFGDNGKIGLVLGSSFIEKVKDENFEFAAFADYDGTVTDDLKRRSIYTIKPESEWDFNSIYES
jgi:5-methylcytosine-specific restriction endonuclease McrBC GTP-binding regulatory subunit McrB